jgi:hypothetical protein
MVHVLTPTEYLLMDTTHFLLSCVYILVAILTAYLRFGHKTPSNRVVWQYTFSIALLLGIATRAVFFYIVPFNSAKLINIPNKANFVLGTLPPFLFLSCYMLILFLWAEIYHDVSAELQIRMQHIYFGIQAVLYGLVAILFIVDIFTTKSEYKAQVEIVSGPEIAVMVIDATLYIVTALAFLVYGIGFYYKFTRVNRALLVKMRHTILPKVKYFTALCSLCFLVRGGLTLSNAVSNWPMNFWWFDLGYYGLLEIVPIILMLFILRAKTSQRTMQAEEPRINENPYANAASDSD